MIANMPIESFFFYYILYALEFIFVVGFGIRWYTLGKKKEEKKKKRSGCCNGQKGAEKC